MNIGNPLRICEDVRSAILASEAVRAIIESRVYPYTTDKVVNAPHVILSGVNVNYSDTKDGSMPDSVDVTVEAKASDYNLCINLATAIVDTLLEYACVSVSSVGCDLNDAANMYVHTINITIQL